MNIAIILAFFLAPILILLCWNTYSLTKYLYKRSEQQQIADSRYFELKYKLEYITAIFAVISIVAALVGYNFSDTIKEYGEDVKTSRAASAELIETITLQRKQLKADSAALAQNKVIINSFAENIQILSDRYRKLKADGDRENRPNTYIISEVKHKPDYGYQEYSFSSFTTITGSPLPEFSHPPLVLPISNSGMIMDVRKITATSFEVGFTQAFADESAPSPSWSFSLFITERK